VVIPLNDPASRGQRITLAGRSDIVAKLVSELANYPWIWGLSGDKSG